MRGRWHESSAWFGTVTAADLRKVLRLLRTNGPLTIRDIDDDVLTEKQHEWGSRKPSKRALQLLFYRGIVTVSRRSGMLKTYDLTTRHFGWIRPPRAATERETLDYLLDRALRSQGIVSLDSVCHLEPGRKPAVRRAIEARRRRGELAYLARENRRYGSLLVPAWTWIAKGGRRERKRRIEEALHRFERFQLEL